MKVESLAEVRNGKLEIPDRQGFMQAVACLAGRVLITIEYVRDKRSTRQNRYMWGVVYKLLSDHLGYTPEEIHDICKVKFNLKKFDLPDGEHIEIGGSTADMQIDEFSRYVEDVRRWASADLNMFTVS